MDRPRESGPAEGVGPEPGGGEGVGVVALGLGGAEADVERLVALEPGADGDAVGGGPEGLGDLLARDAEGAEAGRGDDGAHEVGAVAPVGLHLDEAAVGVEGVEGLLAEAADGVGVGAEDAELDLLRVAGAEGEALAGDHRVGEVRGGELVDLGGDLGDAPVVVEVDEEDAVGGIVVLGGVGEHEAQAAGAGQLRGAGDAVEGADVFGEGREAAVGGADGGALGHPEVDHHLPARGVREEDLPDASEALEGGEEHHGHRGEDEEAVAEAGGEGRAVDAVEPAAVGVGVRRARLLPAGREEVGGEQRREGDREDPGEEQRHHQDDEERAAVFAGGVLRGADGGEGEDGDDGAAEERPHVLRHDLAGGLDLVEALLGGDEDGVADDDGVVDEHPERDDEGAERDALHQDALLLHHGERGHHREDQDAADDEARAEAHEEEEDGDDDDDGLEQVDHEARDGGLDGLGLVGDHPDLDADGGGGLELPEALLEGLRHHGDVAAGDGGDAEGDAGVAVVAQDRGGRVLVAAADGREVAEADGGAGGGVAADDEQVAELVEGAELAGGVDADVLVADGEVAGLDGLVLAGDEGLDLGEGDAEAGEAGAGDLEVDDLVPVAGHVDLGHLVAEQELAAEGLRVVLELRQRVAVAVDDEIHSVDVAEVVDHDRPAAPSRQGRGVVVHLAADVDLSYWSCISTEMMERPA